MRFFLITPASFNGLISLANRIEKSKEIHFQCKTAFFRPFCVAFLDQYISSLDRVIKIYSTYEGLNQYLFQNRFPYISSSAKRRGDFPQEYMILLKRFNSKTSNLNDEVPLWLEKEIFLKRFAPNFSTKLRKQIVKNLWEIIFNAIQHSESKNGISCCGQFYPKMGYFEIAFYDHGVGIPFNIRSFREEFEKYTDFQCIEWALKAGTTTKPENNTGGLGLHYLREFLRLNGGWLQIISKSGIYQSEGKSRLPAEHIKNSFKGTLFNLRIIYDDYTYKFMGETT